MPAVRDLAWQDLYRQHKGQIDEQFAFLAFRTAPLVSASTMDAKVITADMANKMMVWAAIGKPNQREWLPGGRSQLTRRTTACIPAATTSSTPSTGRPRPGDSPRQQPARRHPPQRGRLYESRLWKGWILPASEADTWFVAGAAAYHRLLAADESGEGTERDAHHVARPEARAAKRDDARPIEQTKGILFLDALRRKLGDDTFLKLMTDYFAANTTKTVTAQTFLDKAGVRFESPSPATVRRT